jgi:thioredoxin reductase
MEAERVDVCVVGGGPAGLNAAQILGRCRRRVVLFDSGQPRNAASRALHGYLSRDGIPPLELRRLGREELARYPSVRVADRKVVGVERVTGSHPLFRVHCAQGDVLEARALLLATGREDELPERPGFKEFYGRGVYHCPFCDGWEHRDARLIAYGRGEDAWGVALELLTWSPKVTLCTDGAADLTPIQRAQLERNGIQIVETEVARLEGRAGGELERVRLVAGPALECDALFFVSCCSQRSSLPERLGCELDGTGGVICQAHAATGVPGLFVAGNVRGGLHFAITAAAEGAEAAVAINELLLEQDLRP